jgi:GTPase
MRASKRTGSTAKHRRHKAKGLPPTEPGARTAPAVPSTGEGTPHAAAFSPERELRDQDSLRLCGFIALIGAPNVGKSTLVNALVGSKVAIVSHKVQTTRSPLRGIAIAGRSQLIFVDTPGIFAPKRRLDRAMVTSAWTGAHDADVVAVILDAKRGIDAEAGVILDKLADLRARKILLINKVDLVEKSLLLEIARQANSQAMFAATFMVSALTGDGVADVKNWLAGHVPQGPWLYPEDQVTDAPLRQLAAEITREKLYSRLHQELPYASTVETDQWQERRDGSIRIEQTIYVERESQRKIVLGKAGRTIKAIGTDARNAIAAMVEAPVHLFLFVKVRERWGDDRDRYRAMGLEFPTE